MQNKHKAFYLSLALEILNTVQREEIPKSARWNKLNNVNDRVSEASRIYNPDGFNPEDMGKAVIAIEHITAFINDLYSDVQGEIEFQI